MNEKGKKIIDYVYGNGVNFELTLTLEEALCNLFRNLIFNQLEKKLETDPHGYQTREMRKVLPLFLIENSKIAFNFKTIEEFST